MIKSRHIIKTLLSVALLTACVSCVCDDYDNNSGIESENAVAVELNILTRAITSSGSEQYVKGGEWENYIDIAKGDYRIYFFTYDPDNANDEMTNNILITEFKPTELHATDMGTYTTYTVSGRIDEDHISSLENFKVVVIANWGANKYPTVTAGETNIDDICNAGTFNAMVSDGSATVPSSSLHIPFFGVREYSGVTWRKNHKTILNGDITLLRSVAKVEVILEPSEDQDGISFDNVSLVNYNAEGHCAPFGVYLKGDYDSGYADWSGDFTNTLHLVGNGNDSESKTLGMQKTAATTTTRETWTCYLTEYDNSGDDYSYISVEMEGDTYQIYFANYTAGEASSTADYNICRNYLYCYHVTVGDGVIKVVLKDWERLFDNEYSFDAEN